MTDRRAVHQKRADFVSFGGNTATRVFSDESAGLDVFERVGPGDCVYGTAFSGLRCRPDYNYRFQSQAAATAYREKWVEGKRAGLQAKKDRADERRVALQAMAKSFSVGDVLVSCWGYEQTNYDYYQVTRVFGARSVEIRQLARKTVENSAQAMTGQCVPIKNRFVGAPMVKRVNEQGGVMVQGAWASKKETVTIAGVDVFKPDHFTSYA